MHASIFNLSSESFFVAANGLTAAQKFKNNEANPVAVVHVFGQTFLLPS
jgi:hypothetical protein